jgi:hypothetical protein
MIGAFVTFRYGDNFDEQAVRKALPHSPASNDIDKILDG